MKLSAKNGPKKKEKDWERETNQYVDKGSNNDGVIAAEIRVRHKSSQQRQQRGGAGPCVDVGGGGGGRLAQWPDKEAYEVGPYAVVGEPLRNLDSDDEGRGSPPAGARSPRWTALVVGETVDGVVK